MVRATGGSIIDVEGRNASVKFNIVLTVDPFGSSMAAGLEKSRVFTIQRNNIMKSGRGFSRTTLLGALGFIFSVLPTVPEGNRPLAMGSPLKSAVLFTKAPASTPLANLRSQVLTEGLPGSRASLLLQVLDLAKLRIVQGQYAAAATLLKSFNNYCLLFLGEGASTLTTPSSAIIASLTGISGGLAGYWKFDEGFGSTAADSSGNGDTGTLINSPTWTAGKIGGALQFNGFSNFVDVPNFSWPAGGGPVTVAFWNFVAATPSQGSSAFSIGNLDGPNRFQAHVPWPDNVLYWDYGNISGTGRVQTNYSAYLGSWTHVTLVSAGQGGSFMGIYLNGVLQASSGASDGPTPILSGATIGAWAANGLFHPGKIDDFRVYSRVLSQNEIDILAGTP